MGSWVRIPPSASPFHYALESVIILTVPRVNHFEIHATDPAITAGFYSAVFGWKISKWAGPVDYWLVSTGEGPGIDGGIVPRQGAAPVLGAAVNAFVCTTTVDSLEKTSAAVLENDGELVVPQREIPGVGLLAYFKDPDGNLFGVLQPA
jgi:uncharacterized protein